MKSQACKNSAMLGKCINVWRNFHFIHNIITADPWNLCILSPIIVKMIWHSTQLNNSHSFKKIKQERHKIEDKIFTLSTFYTTRKKYQIMTLLAGEFLTNHKKMKSQARRNSKILWQCFNIWQNINFIQNIIKADP